MELSDQSVYTASMVICEAMPRESELHCEASCNPILEMTVSTAVSPALVPRGGNWLYDLAHAGVHTFRLRVRMLNGCREGKKDQRTAGWCRRGIQGLGIPAPHRTLHPAQSGGQAYESNLLHLSRCADKDAVG